MKYPYEYMLHVWGGAIQENKLEHLTYTWFKTKKERDNQENAIKQIANKSNNNGLAISRSQGYLTRHNFIIKSLVKYKDQFYWVYNKLGYGFFDEEDLEEGAQDYMLDWKWNICLPQELEDKDIVLLNTSLIIEEPVKI